MKRVLMLVLTSIIVACSGTISNDLPPTLIVALRGDVYVLRQGAMLKAEVGMVLVTDDIIKTGSNAFAQISFNNSSLTAGDEAVLSLGSTPKGLATRIIGGDVVFKIEKVVSDEYVVQTPTNQFKVRGTEFVVSVNHLTNIAVSSGAVEVFDATGQVPLAMVNAGKQLVIDPKGAVFIEQEIDEDQLVFIDNLNGGRFERLTMGSVAPDDKSTEIKLLEQQVATLADELSQQKNIVSTERIELEKYRAQAAAAIDQWTNERALVDRYKMLLEEAGVEYPVLE